MQELLEQAVNSPQVQYMLENPDIAVSGAFIGSIATQTAAGMAGQIKGEHEIEKLDQKHDGEAYQEAVFSRKDELAEGIERDSALREIYNHVVHAYTSGKLGAFEEEETRIKGVDFGERGSEYYRQKFTDDDLDYLD